MGSVFRVEGSGLRVLGSGFGVSGSGDLLAPPEKTRLKQEAALAFKSLGLRVEDGEGGTGAQGIPAWEWRRAAAPSAARAAPPIVSPLPTLIFCTSSPCSPFHCRRTNPDSSACYCVPSLPFPRFRPRSSSSPLPAVHPIPPPAPSLPAPFSRNSPHRLSEPRNSSQDLEGRPSGWAYEDAGSQRRPQQGRS